MPHKYSPQTFEARQVYQLNTAHSGWGVDTHLVPTLHEKDDKYSPKAIASASAIYFASLKAFIGRLWHSQMSRSHPTLPKPSLTSTSQASSPVVFILLCALWYSTSALASNTGKAILTQFRYPITLTFVQFGFVAVYCLLFMSPLIRFSKLRAPSRTIIQNTLPMGMFQVGGHMFSSIAISRIPVSTVHTIKALSPLFTVAAYALLFGVSYSTRTYASLLPLMVGVMLACSFDMSASNATGLLCAFGSALVFVSSNIFFKKIMPTNGGGLTQSAHKLDKLNLLLYSASMAFILMIPLWLYHDLPLLYASTTNPSHVIHPTGGHETPHSVMYYIFMNGTVNFAQNIIAFVILSSTSPVTYSIASLIKRVVVICIAIIWFNQRVHLVQGLGIILTFTGLYMYNNAKSDVEMGEKKMRRVKAACDMMLPTNKTDSILMGGTEHPPVFTTAESSSTGLCGTAYGRGRNVSPATSHTFFHPSTIPSHPYSHPSHLSIKTSTIPNHPTDTHGPRGSSSYPSPPSSVDSPPSEAISLPDTQIPSNTLWSKQTYQTAVVAF
ncbi:hypothetical protein H2248_010714 [Termitomyces sp. 'cryptogamus']|nr:hypothetical protein H2248_010714 [Termitomyces sp. 'cryptogamus']